MKTSSFGDWQFGLLILKLLGSKSGCFSLQALHKGRQHWFKQYFHFCQQVFIGVFILLIQFLFPGCRAAHNKCIAASGAGRWLLRLPFFIRLWLGLEVSNVAFSFYLQLIKKTGQRLPEGSFSIAPPAAILVRCRQFFLMTLLIISFLLGHFLFLITRTALGRNKTVNLFWQNAFFKIYIVGMIIYLLSFFAEKYNYHLRGYRSTSILFLTMTIAGTVYWLIDRGKVFNQIFRTALFCFQIVTLALSLLLFMELIGDYQNQLIYNDVTYRLEDTRRGIGEPCILPTLFVKNNFYEQEFKLSDTSLYQCLGKSDISKIEIKPIAEGLISVLYFHSTDGFEGVPNPLKAIYRKK